MKKSQKYIAIITIVFIWCISIKVYAFDATKEIEQLNNLSKQNLNLSLDEKNEEDVFQNYKEGEVIITYEQSFFNSTAKLSLSSFFDKFSVEDTIKFEDIKIEDDKTLKIADENSKKSTFAVSLIKSDKHSTKELIDIFKDKDWIITAEPNYIIKASSLTNDSYQKYQWALENNGQNSGNLGADVNPVETSSSKEKVIAVIDSGVDYTNEDLKNVMWKNPYSSKDLPGTYGYDFVNNDSDPMDDAGHGTHCAGVIAGEANNNKGISGINLGASNIKIMALKIFDSDGKNTDLYRTINAYNYIIKAQKMGTNVIAINNSWGGVTLVEDLEKMEVMKTLKDLINIAGQQGALSICAAGNEEREVDKNGRVYIDVRTLTDNKKIIEQFAEDNYLIECLAYPAGIDSEYIVTVAASNEKDDLAFFSNYGEGVDIAAPGTHILSTMSADNEENGKFDKREFLPSIYSKEKINETCDVYLNFEDSTEIPFDVATGKGACEAKLSISNEKSFETGKKSLKIEFDATTENNVGAIRFKDEFAKYNWVTARITSEKEYPQAIGLWCTKIYSISGDVVPNGGFFELINDLWTPIGMNTGDGWSETGPDKEMLDSFGIKPEIFTEKASGYLNYYFVFTKPGHYVFYLDDFAISKIKSKDECLVPYGFEDGTSMATPHITGAIGTLSNLFENNSALQLKNKMLSCIRKSTNLEKKVTTGGTLDLSKIPTSQLENSFEDYNEVIQDGKQYLINIAPNTTFEDMLKKIKSNGIITLYKNNNEITDKKTKISTGMKLKISYNDTNSEYIIVVKGDSNGDGIIDIKDILQINKHRLNKISLKGENLLSGDVNKDNKVDIKDILQINKFRLNKINTL